MIQVKIYKKNAVNGWYTLMMTKLPFKVIKKDRYEISAEQLRALIRAKIKFVIIPDKEGE